MKTTSVISARVPNATKRKLHQLAERVGTSPSAIVGVLLSALPHAAAKTLSNEQSDALSKVLAALGLPGNATVEAIKAAIDKLLGIDGLDGDDPDPDGGGNEGALDDTSDPEAPAVLSEYGYKVPSAAEVGRVAAKLSESKPSPRDGIRKAPEPAFVVDSVTNQVKVNPARYARKAR